MVQFYLGQIIILETAGIFYQLALGKIELVDTAVNIAIE
jgi:hypothetical protein